MVPFDVLKHIYIVFSNCLKMKYINICKFFTMDDILIGTVTISATLKEIHFPKISLHFKMYSLNEWVSIIRS